MDWLALPELRDDDGLGPRGARRDSRSAASQRRRNVIVRISCRWNRLGCGFVRRRTVDSNETVDSLATMDWQRVVDDHDTRLGAEARRRLKQLA